MPDGAAVHARDLERRFGAARVLRGLSLDVAQGSITALFGPNGSGKTTFLKIVAGLASPQRGTVSVLGEAMPAGAAHRARIGVVAHDSFLYGDLTAIENLEYYARLYRIADPSRAAALVADVGLERAKDRPARTFSRGMIQRLSIARALVHDPELLLLDEPFTGLDPQGEAWLTDTIRTCKAAGKTVMLTSHDFAQAAALADAAAILSAGRIAWHEAGFAQDAAGMAEIYHRTVEAAR